MKICTPENYPLYGWHYDQWNHSSRLSTQVHHNGLEVPEQTLVGDTPMPGIGYEDKPTELLCLRVYILSITTFSLSYRYIKFGPTSEGTMRQE